MAGRAILGGPSSSSSQQQPAGERGVNPAGGAGASGGERYFSVRWMLERERAREASDDCSSAFAIIPVVGVCLLALYIVWLDKAAQHFVLWLVRETPLARLSPFNLFFSGGVDEWEEWPGPGLAGGGGGGWDSAPMMEAFA